MPNQNMSQVPKFFSRENFSRLDTGLKVKYMLF